MKYNGIIKEYKSLYNNYYSVLFKLYFMRVRRQHNDKMNIFLILKDGQRINTTYGNATTFSRLHNYENSNISNLSLKCNGISFYYKNKQVLLDIPNFSDIESVFFREDYKFLNANNVDIIDIGMNLGDSAIYFAVNGAKRVIGLEPYPYIYSFAERNIKMNKFDNIIPLNAGYGNDSYITVNATKITGTGESLKTSNNGIKISIYSLKTLINKYKIGNAMLKMAVNIIYWMKMIPY